MSCVRPPPFSDIFLPLGETFGPAFFRNPRASPGRQFLHSRMFFFLFLWYVVFRMGRSLARAVNKMTGVSFGILALVHSVALIEAYRRLGAECTAFGSLVVFVVYLTIDRFFAGQKMALNSVNTTPVVGSAILTDASKVDGGGMLACRRLALCRSTPVHARHKSQRLKHRKCIECAEKSKSIQYDNAKIGCRPEDRDNGTVQCHKCHETAPPPEEQCDTACRDIETVMDLIDPDDDGQGLKYPDRAGICRESRGSLCWFACAGSVCGGGVPLTGWDGKTTVSGVADASGNGSGYPTREVCEAHSGSKCVRLTSCAGDPKMLAECACSKHIDALVAENPCAFFEGDCDENSIEYSEALLKMKQGEISTADIVSVGDVQKFVSALDTLAKSIP